MADIGCRDGVAHRSRVLERLGDLPRAGELLAFVLEGAARHVDADGVAEDMIERSGERDVLAALRKGHHHLDLEMDARALRGIGEGGTAEHEVVRVLLEEERWIA